MAIKAEAIPREFVWRRLHSLMGLWFLIFLMEHLFTNSQAAIFFGEGANWFVRSVDFLQNLPYLHAVEVILLGVPITYHALWGIYYMISSRPNSFPSDGSKPVMKYRRSKAYTWQRLSAWVLVVGIVLHVLQMRFFDYPYKYIQDGGARYYVKLHVDPGLYPVADRLGVELYDQRAIDQEKCKLSRLEHKIHMVEGQLEEVKGDLFASGQETTYNSELDHIYQSMQGYESKRAHIRGLESRKLGKHDVMAVSKSFGSLELLSVRQAFQSVFMCILYTIFVAAAVFHGGNGLWTFLITWGVILSKKSQSKMSTVSIGLIFVLALLGMMSIWGTYFLSST